MRTYASSQVKRKNVYRNSELQMFLLISGSLIGGPKHYFTVHQYGGVSIINILCETFQQIHVHCNSETVGHKDLKFGQIVYILVSYNIHFLGFFHWTVSNLFFVPCLLCNSENEELK